MTIILTPIAHGDLCHGARWSVQDLDVLAERVARVALGQYRHVAQILEGLTTAAPRTDAELAEDAKSKLVVAQNGDPWQRDGWLFQIISWIAANQELTDRAVLAPPHIFHAHKGFDGMQLEIAADGVSVAAVVIFEDKATANPRDTIRDEVWPAIVEMEAGKRMTELSHIATGVLEAQQRLFPALDVDQAVDRIVWQQMRRYRVSITTGATHSSDNARQRLFGGYDVSAAGGVTRRNAGTMHFDDLRDWMDKFSSLVSSKLDEAVNV